MNFHTGGPIPAPLLIAPPRVSGMDDQTQDLVNRLVKTWAAKFPRNALRGLYLDMKIAVKNLDLAIAPDLADDLKIVCGWPAKAVYGLANLCMWDGPASPDGVEDPFELRDVLTANRFDVELPQAVVSSMTKSVVFESTTPGDTASGEPPVLVMSHSADWASAIWDRRTRGLRAAMLINDADDLGRPTMLTVMTPFEAVICENRGAGWFVSDVREHGLRRVPVEPMPFRPSLERPFGRSRVSRAVMTITDRAIRAALRMDVAAEIFSGPGLLLNGVTEEQWEQVRSWTWKMGAVKGLTAGEDVDSRVDVHRLASNSPSPFVEQMRELAAEFSGETSLPLSSLGVVQDNPPSAEAIYAAKEDLVIEAANANKTYSYPLNRIYQNIVMIRDGLEEVPPELARISTRWRNPAMPSIVSQSDAMVKQISAIPELADTDVALEEMGYTGEQIVRIRSQIRRARAQRGITGFMENFRDAHGKSVEPTEDAP